MIRSTCLSSLAAGLLLAGCATAPATQSLAERTLAEASDADAELINRSEVVAVVGSVDAASDLEVDAARWGYDLKRKEALSSLGIWMLTFDCPPGIDPRVASLELERLVPRAAVEPNHAFTLESALLDVRDMSAPREYANALIGWPEEGCEAVVRVGVIDGPADATHLPGARVASRDFVPETEVPALARRHGGAVASLIAGEGRLRDAELFAASVVGTSTDGRTEAGVEPMLRALDWMVGEDVRVVNISLAGPRNATLSRGLEAAARKGTLVVAAVGNQGPDSPPRYPSALGSVIAATAVDSDRNVYSRAVRGAHVDVAAPGVDVFVPGPDGGRYMSGTSIAAPFVTARLAADPAWESGAPPATIAARLLASTEDLGLEGPDPVYGRGVLSMRSGCPT